LVNKVSVCTSFLWHGGNLVNFSKLVSERNGIKRRPHSLVVLKIFVCHANKTCLLKFF